jgi:hypothetical protein
LSLGFCSHLSDHTHPTTPTLTAPSSPTPMHATFRYNLPHTIERRRIFQEAIRIGRTFGRDPARKNRHVTIVYNPVSGAGKAKKNVDLTLVPVLEIAGVSFRSIIPPTPHPCAHCTRTHTHITHTQHTHTHTPPPPLPPPLPLLLLLPTLTIPTTTHAHIVFVRVTESQQRHTVGTRARSRGRWTTPRPTASSWLVVMGW